MSSAASAAQQGGALALDRLLDDLAPYVRRLCARITPAAAGDAAQEALLAIRFAHQHDPCVPSLFGLRR